MSCGRSSLAATARAAAKTATCAGSAAPYRSETAATSPTRSSATTTTCTTPFASRTGSSAKAMRPRWRCFPASPSTASRRCACPLPTRRASFGKRADDDPAPAKRAARRTCPSSKRKSVLLRPRFRPRRREARQRLFPLRIAPLFIVRFREPSCGMLRAPSPHSSRRLHDADRAARRAESALRRHRDDRNGDQDCARLPQSQSLTRRGRLHRVCRLGRRQVRRSRLAESRPRCRPRLPNLTWRPPASRTSPKTP